MKIVWTDNFARDNVSERLVAENIKHKSEAEAMLKGLQDTCTELGSSWYKLEQDDYVLYKWEP